MDPPDPSYRGQEPSRSEPPPPALSPSLHPLTPARSNTARSSTVSAGSKRKRGEVDDDDEESNSATTRSVRSRHSLSSDFNAGTKHKVKQLANARCWHCNGKQAEICHVIGSRDETFKRAEADGLIDVPKHHYQNAIALCPNCHTSYDNMYEPSFFFLPTDLSYFINFEKHDQARRLRLGRATGTIPGRTCPTAELYHAHQVRHGVLEPETAGGLYTRLVLDDYMGWAPGQLPFTPGLSSYGEGPVKSWWGSPMAALHRAVFMLRWLNVKGVPRQIKRELRELQDLYSMELDLSQGIAEEDEVGDDTDQMKTLAETKLPQGFEEEDADEIGRRAGNETDRNKVERRTKYEPEGGQYRQDKKSASHRNQQRVTKDIQSEAGSHAQDKVVDTWETRVSEWTLELAGACNGDTKDEQGDGEAADEKGGGKIDDARAREEIKKKIEDEETRVRNEDALLSPNLFPVEKRALGVRPRAQPISKAGTRYSKKWCWGPTATSNEAARFFRRVM